MKSLNYEKNYSIMPSSSRRSVFGSALMVSGCCIGAGMLGLPLVSLSFGFFLSLLPLFFSWAYMYFSGLMILEVYIGQKENINLMSLLERTLGKGGKVPGAGLFAFLFYSILTAYLNASSVIIRDALQALYHLEISQTISLLGNSICLFALILIGTRRIDLVNRLLVFVMLIFYIGLVAMGFSQVKQSNITTFSPSSLVIFSMPIFIVSFGFQNLVPTISHYLRYDVANIKKALFSGATLALVIYLLWNFTILGMISPGNQLTSEASSVVLTKLFDYPSPLIAFFINSFSLFALITSLLTVAMSFMNFISDASENQRHRLFFSACVIVPPTVFSLFDPNIFLFALHIAGGIGAISLFGILPALMVWKMRYRLKRFDRRIFPFGKFGLGVYLFLSGLMVILEIINVLTKTL